MYGLGSMMMGGGGGSARDGAPQQPMGLFGEQQQLPGIAQMLLAGRGQGINPMAAAPTAPKKSGFNPLLGALLGIGPGILGAGIGKGKTNTAAGIGAGVGGLGGLLSLLG